FPSTDDVAALASKIALLRVAELYLGGELGDGELEELLRSFAVKVSEIPHRSKLHKQLAGSVKKCLEDSRDSNNCSGVRGTVERFVRGRWWTPRLLYYWVLRAWEQMKACGDDRRLAVAAGLLLAVDIEFYDMLSADSELAGLLKSIGRRIRRLASGSENRELLLDIAEALEKPRLYYGIVRFDMDSMGKLLRGRITKVEEGRPLTPREYLEELLESHERVLEKLRQVSPGSIRFAEAREGVSFLRRYLLEGYGRRVGDEVLKRLAGLADPCGRVYATVFVSPSYHYAISNSIAYTLLRLGIVAGRLGGIPVVLGGDEGLIFVPAWLPKSLLPEGTLEGYMSEYGRATGFDDLWRVGAESPAVLVSLLVPRIMWASSAAKPGFHPVKRRGRGWGVLYRIPALLGAGVSVALRFAHYRDHLYAELALADELLEEGKRRGGCRFVVSMGRVQPARVVEGLSTAAVLPIVVDGGTYWFRSAGMLLAAAGLLAGLVDSGAASISLLRGVDRLVEGGAEALKGVVDYGLAEGVVEYLVERYVGGRYADRVKELLMKVLYSSGFEGLLDVLRAGLYVLEAMRRSGEAG
ncbi:MAG: hypothetical protein GXO09_04360, partial [Crenarchaeota archaeon]|nr:hypothetical protein [Thermoproteota archaeon]